MSRVSTIKMTVRHPARSTAWLEEAMPNPYSLDWNIQRTGRAWRKEALARYEFAPEKIEMVDGKLFWSDEDRVMMLGLLLENVGVDRAVRLGDPRVWRDAISALDGEREASCGGGAATP